MPSLRRGQHALRGAHTRAEGRHAEFFAAAPAWSTLGLKTASRIASPRAGNRDRGRGAVGAYQVFICIHENPMSSQSTKLLVFLITANRTRFFAIFIIFGENTSLLRFPFSARIYFRH